ncbi:hypothetical protein [Sphingobacterium sp.]|uniref:hypothetical protein n=1 Tax=Sphingobacterium sp. TaxID=341027 RepID=UPI002582B55E|nr:hypothetical protein [Sphingobacterium sp.]WET67131.1 MAG: hypothetical protein P0Y57_14945 [Sphingobacterium sp.]
MKAYTLWALSVVMGCFSSTAQELLSATKPSKAQQLMIKRGYGMFVHFGVNNQSRALNTLSALDFQGTIIC